MVYSIPMPIFQVVTWIADKNVYYSVLDLNIVQYMYVLMFLQKNSSTGLVFVTWIPG
jgi:hypothetical protein